ncbi:unnamed protein product, partial [Mesorhabditis spiculigera]
MPKLLRLITPLADAGIIRVSPYQSCIDSAGAGKSTSRPRVQRPPEFGSDLRSRYLRSRSRRHPPSGRPEALARPPCALSPSPGVRALQTHFRRALSGVI